jgi:hypothetical protein
MGYSRKARAARHALLVASAALALACGRPPAGRDCASQADCPSDAHCRSGLCVADQPPVAVVGTPGALVSNAPLRFDAHGSHDPDPGDAVSGWSWDVRPAGASSPACEPLVSAGRDQAELTVLFPCGGEFDVSLVVADSLGVTSAPSTVRVAVATSPDPPQVTAGPDGRVEHRCAGAPLVCTPWDGASTSFALSAQATGPLGVTFRYRWTATPPPELEGQPAPRVRFVPGPDVASPDAFLETEGTAIAGRWTFTVVATDSRELSAIARQRLDVGNRPPVIVGGGALEVPHRYEPASRTFTASGTTPPATWSDPDGDPLAPLGFTWVHEGDGAGTFGGTDLGDRASFAVSVPYGRPEDASLLLGPGVTRRIDVAVADVNGARSAASWSVAVGNRPPRLVDPVPATAVDHAYDAAGRRYVARAPLSAWADDDGDPLVPSVSGDAGCAAATEDRGRVAVTCEMPYPGIPAAGSFARRRELVASVRDPWAPGPSQATRLEIRNRAPRLLADVAQLSTSCGPSPTCCDEPPGARCQVHDAVMAPASGAVPLLADDDGDPLDVTVLGDPCLAAAAPQQPCPAAGCEVGLSLCGGALLCGAFQPAGVLSLAASDGLAAASGVVSVESICR